MIKRQFYLQQLVKEKDRNIIKVITGMRRSGKSVLLFELYYDYLIASGIKPNHIIKVNLENLEMADLRDAKKLYDYCLSKINDKEKYYIMLDEIQYVDNFEDVLNSLNNKGCDVYVTGSNSKLLSGEINTALRGRSIEIRVFPLSFSEFFAYAGGDKKEALDNFMLYGGLPYVATLPDKESKIQYLKMINETVVVKDIVDRHSLKNIGTFESVVKFMYSNIGSLTSVNKIAKTLSDTVGVKTTVDSIANYLSYLGEAFLFYKVFRYDIKGKEYLKSLNKYYATDLGLRNAYLDFRQIEPTHAMENLIYLELLKRGYKVSVGLNGAKEVDFVAEKDVEIYYIQSAYSISDTQKRATELASFNNLDDGYKKIVITMDDDPYKDLGKGYRKINLIDFLLDDSAPEAS